MDRGFIALLLLTAASGLALALARSTGAMAPLLALHLGAVMALFVMLPYSKFAHGAFRAAALLKYAVEKRRPNVLGVGDE
jgi:citrate/tricarballylate utilization protein